MTQNRLIGRSHSKKHYHQQSMDDFIKNIKKFNLRSQRYIASKPFHMYLKHNTTKTMQKSRSHTLSNRKSVSKSKKVKKRIQTLLSQQSLEKSEKNIKASRPSSSSDQNIGELIEFFGERINKVQKYLEHKNQIGVLLCAKFKEMLNKIIETTLVQINESIKQIEKQTITRIEKSYDKKLKKLTNYNKKLEQKTAQLIERLQNNSNLIYSLRINQKIDVDYLFGMTVLGTDKCGGRGYRKEGQELDQREEYGSESDQYIQNRGLQIREMEQESGRIRPAFVWEKQAYENGHEQRELVIQRKSL